MSPLKILSSMATRELLLDLAAQYSKDFSQPLICEAAGGVDVAKRVSGGEAVDIVVLAGSAIDKLIFEGSVLQGSRVDLVRSGVAIAVRKGAPRPSIETEEAVKQAVLNAQSLSYSTGPSGVYLEKLFERWGILQTVKNKIVVPPPGTAVGSLLASGECELGFQQLSEMMNLAGIEVVGPLPAAIQTITTFAGGVAACCRSPEAARAVLNFMASPAATEAKRRHGMDDAAA